MTYAVAVISSVCSAGGGAALHAAFGYRSPLITFYPAILLSAWLGGFGPGLVATSVSASLVEYLWLWPLRTAHQTNPGDQVALALFIGIGLAISGFHEASHRSTAREHAARQRAETGERALQESERDLRAALAREQTARAEAELANRLKDQFVAIVSHELRTPLNALAGWTDLLKRGALDESRRERALEAIQVNAARQAQLVDDLLDIAGMMSGKLQLHRTPVRVDEIIRAALDIVKPAAEQKRIDVAVDVHAPLAPVRADAMRLQQIFWNLIANAIKFTPEHGMVRVQVHRVNDSIEVLITDTGQGIPTEHLESIFEPFYQADRSMTRSQGGLGLGLSIVKYLVAAHSGSVTAESAGMGRGATFKVKLPIAADAIAPEVELGRPS